MGLILLCLPPLTLLITASEAFVFVHRFYRRSEGSAITFTYNISTPPYGDISRIRFAIGDTDSTAVIFSDEELTFRLSESGDYKHAVIDCIQSVIARLATTPDFTADWLTVNQTTALKSWQSLLVTKRQEYGIPLITASAVYQYRPDSRQTAAPTFTDVDDLDLDGDDDD